MVDFNQLHQSGFIAIAFDHKATLALVVNMLVVQIGKLNEGFIGLFKPVAHHTGVVVELVNKAQIFALKGRSLTCSASVMGIPVVKAERGDGKAAPAGASMLRD